MFEIKLIRTDHLAKAMGLKQEIVTTMPDTFTSEDLAVWTATQWVRREPAYEKVQLWKTTGEFVSAAIRSFDNTLVWA